MTLTAAPVAFAPAVYVDRFAVGNGATDDRANINAAIAEAVAAGARLVFGRNKTYLVSDNVVFLLGLAGVEGNGATIKLAASAASGTTVVTLATAATGLEVVGLGVDGNGVANATGIRPHGNDQAIRRCRLVNCPAGGVYVDGAQAGLDVTHNRFSGGGYGVLFADASTASDVLIDGNRFAGGAVGDAIEVNTPAGGASDVTITNNRISGYANTGASGIGIGLARVNGAIVKGNTVKNCGNDGIHVENDSQGVLIADNRVKNCARSGISVQAGAGAVAPKHGTIAGNHVAGCGTGAGQGAIALEGGTQVAYWTVEGNVVRGNGRAGATYYGIDLGVGGIGHTCEDNKVSNTIGNNTAGIRWNGATGYTVAGNACWDDQGTKTQQWGIRAYGVNTDVVLIGNQLAGNLSGTIDEAVISAASTGYVKRYNRPSGVDNGAVVPIVAGAISDASFGGVVPLNGFVGIDSANGRIYVKYGGNWHYVALT